MSVTTHVFLDDAKMLDATDWAKAIRSNQFDMELTTDIDVRSFSGFLPCTYQGEDAGFEYSRDAAVALGLDEATLANVGHRGTVITFDTHSDLRELMTATIACAVLCASVDGVLWDTEANVFVPAKDALTWARHMEATIQDAL